MLTTREIAQRTTHTLFPLALFAATLLAWGLVAIVLPLHGLFFSSAFQATDNVRPSIAESWGATALLLVALLLLCCCYSFALRSLPTRVGLRYIVMTAGVFGGICVCISVVTSPDLFSYILYARMATLYHLNPLVTTPLAVANDPLYSYLYWKDQPSAYGPTWVVFSGLLQSCCDLLFGTKNLFATVLSFRLFGLVAHLWSCALVWSICRTLQPTHKSAKSPVLATLAFAWNPLLLFEACINAHNDTILLLFVLLSLWVFVRQKTQYAYLWTTLLLALATCLKLNVAVLVPGLLFFLWQQPNHKQKVSFALLLYCAVLLLCYVPFWANGAMLRFLSVNPGTYRNINSLPDFLGQLTTSIGQLRGSPALQAERITHIASTVLFVLAYSFLCWQALFTKRRLRTFPQLIRWLTTAWLLYCLLGAPWFWPWYATTFFGLFALIIPDKDKQKVAWNSVDTAVYVFAFCLLSSYCFFTWGVYNSSVPLLTGFRWTYLRGVWVWLPVLLLLLKVFLTSHRAEKVYTNS